MKIKCLVVEEDYGEWNKYEIDIKEEELAKLAAVLLREFLKTPFKENDNEAERNSS